MSDSRPDQMAFRYFREEDQRQLERLQFVPRSEVDGRFAGQYRTRQRGQSVEFHDYRAYIPGDDVTAIDWRVYGRTSRLVVRQFEQHSDLTAHLLVDASASMGFQGLSETGAIRSRGTDSKYDFACRLAASIGFLVSRQQDRFSFALAQTQSAGQGSPLREFIPPDRTRQHLMKMLRAMELARPRGQAALAEALHEVAQRGRRRELVIVFSDLLDEPEAVQEALAARIRYGGEAVLMHVLHPHELELPDVERGTFVDSETGDRLNVDVHEVRSGYRARMQAFLDQWESRCGALGIDYCRLTTDQPFQAVLEHFLARRSRLR